MTRYRKLGPNLSVALYSARYDTKAGLSGIRRLLSLCQIQIFNTLALRNSKHNELLFKL